MRFYKELPKSGVVFFWLFVFVFFWRQLFAQWSAYGSGSDWLYTNTIIALSGFAEFLVFATAVAYSWLCYSNLQDRKTVVVKSILYAAVFYATLIISSAINPGLTQLENPQVSNNFFWVSVLIFFVTILDPLFKKYFKNVIVKIIAQIAVMQIGVSILAVLFLFVLTSFIEINTEAYQRALNQLIVPNWPSSLFILGVILINFFGPLAAFGLMALNFAIKILFVYLSATWADLSINTVLAWFVFGVVFFKVELNSKMPVNQ